MQFDDFYQTIGSFGPYQKTKYFLICLTYMFPPIMVYTWSFTAATPSFSCRLSAGGSNVSYVPSESQCRLYQKQISISECQRCFHVIDPSTDNDQHDGPLRGCTDFIFDRTYYQSTLVEEVNICSGKILIMKFLFVVADGLRSCVFEKLCSNRILLWLHGWFPGLWYPIGQVSF
jgi:uncharacterized membrane protein YqaE (UPF0057 family)